MLPEQELIVLCASPVRDASNCARIHEILDASVDWELLQEEAWSHHLTPLVCWTLQEQAPAVVPPQLSADFLHNARKALMLTSELTRVLDLMRANGIEALPFKGPTLAAMAFDNVALRSYDDIDFLVPRTHVWQAREILLANGFSETVPLGPSRDNALLDSHDELVMRGPNGFPLLELHWSFIAPHYSVAMDPDVFRGRATRVCIGDQSIPSLCPTDLFLVLCVHGAKHCWSRLNLLADLAWLMTHQAIDWPAVSARAREIRVERIALIALLLVEKIFRLPMPLPMARGRVDSTAVKVAEQIRESLFGQRHDEFAIVPTARLYMRMRESFRDKLRFAFGLLTRPGLEDLQAADLPEACNFLYRFRRVPRLVRKYWSA